MRKDLSLGRSNLIKLSEIFEIIENTKNIGKFKLSSGTPEFAFITLVELWILKSTLGEKTKIKINKAMGVGFLLAEGIYGFYGGYFDQRHRRASASLKEYISTVNAKNPIMTLRFLYSVLDYYKLTEITEADIERIRIDYVKARRAWIAEIKKDAEKEYAMGDVEKHVLDDFINNLDHEIDFEN